MTTGAAYSGLPEDQIVWTNFCRSRDFLLNKQGTAYYALFTDATQEHIDPITGFPRPSPDAAVRTKNYVLPPQSILDYPLRVIPSRFSGLMRQAVGCYQATGRDAPFTFGWVKTHGIVHIGSTYWVVEISSQGIFAAVVTVGDACCGSWNVTRYMTAGSTELALHSRWQNFDQVNVQRVMAPNVIAPAYALGSPWCGDHGWAFSASGIHAQNVLVDSSSDPVNCYVGARVRVDFAAAGHNRLSAALTIVEQAKKFTLTRGRTVWVPSVSGEWTYADGPTGNEISNPLAVLSSQDAPVHVFYQGEAEQVTRWKLSWAHVDALQVGEPTLLISPKPLVKFPLTCAGDRGMYSPGYDYHTYSLTSAHNVNNSGFVGPGFSHQAANFSTSFESTAVNFGGQQTVTQPPFGNNFDLDSSCYYYWQDPNDLMSPPVLITRCGCTFTDTNTTQDQGEVRRATSQSESNISVVVLFAEERESILAIQQTSQDEHGTESSDITVKRSIHETKTGVPGTDPNSPNIDCPCFEWSVDVAGNESEAVSPSSTTVAVDSSASAAVAVLALGEFGVSVGLPISLFDGNITDDDFATFMRGHPSNHPTANSDVFAMNGNIGSINRAYKLLTFTVNGGFDYNTGELIAFIGQT